MQDSYRLLNKNNIEYTYSNATCTSQSRIDYILNSTFMNGFLKQNEIRNVPDQIPDHRAVILTLNLNFERGTGYWMLNTKWLEHENYKNGVINIINDLVNEYKKKSITDSSGTFVNQKLKTFQWNWW